MLACIIGLLCLQSIVAVKEMEHDSNSIAAPVAPYHRQHQHGHGERDEEGVVPPLIGLHHQLHHNHMGSNAAQNYFNEKESHPYSKNSFKSIKTEVISKAHFGSKSKSQQHIDSSRVGVLNHFQVVPKNPFDEPGPNHSGVDTETLAHTNPFDEFDPNSPYDPLLHFVSSEPLVGPRFTLYDHTKSLSEQLKALFTSISFDQGISTSLDLSKIELIGYDGESGILVKAKAYLPTLTSGSKRSKQSVDVVVRLFGSVIPLGDRDLFELVASEVTALEYLSSRCSHLMGIDSAFLTTIGALENLDLKQLIFGGKSSQALQGNLASVLEPNLKLTKYTNIVGLVTNIKVSGTIDEVALEMNAKQIYDVFGDYAEALSCVNGDGKTVLRNVNPSHLMVTWSHETETPTSSGVGNFFRGKRQLKLEGMVFNLGKSSLIEPAIDQCKQGMQPFNKDGYYPVMWDDDILAMSDSSSFLPTSSLRASKGIPELDGPPEEDCEIETHALDLYALGRSLEEISQSDGALIDNQTDFGGILKEDIIKPMKDIHNLFYNGDVPNMWSRCKSELKSAAELHDINMYKIHGADMDKNLKRPKDIK